MFWSIYWRPKFSIQMLQLFIIKICFTIKVNSICGAGRDTRNLCHKFNVQGPALKILDLRVTNPKPQRPSCGVLGVRVPVLGSWVSESYVLGSQSPRFPGLRVSSLSIPGCRVSGSWVSGPDFRLCPIQKLQNIVAYNSI